MSTAVVPPGGGRGVQLLLAHCAALTRLEDSRPPASARLEQAVGEELARLLVGALAPRSARPVELAA
jgi:hypothetical protein